MPRLLIDGTPIQENPKGVGRYADQVTQGLCELLPKDWEIFLLVRKANLSARPSSERIHSIGIEGRSEIHQALFELPQQARRLQPDVLLKTHEGGGCLGGLPTVTVCHDIDELIWMAQGGPWNPWRAAINFYKKKLRRKVLRSSEVVICNSEFIRGAVHSYYGIGAESTEVAYCAVDPGFYEYSAKTDKAAVLSKYGIERFVLAFATGDRRENFACYPAVAAMLAEKSVKACLLIAGMDLRSAYAAELRGQFVSRGLVEGRDFLFESFLGGDRFQQLVDLYTAADIYLELSLHEGFGMQLVEAMACGTTCISSSRGAMPEIGNKYVRFVDPLDIESVSSAIAVAYAQSAHQCNNAEQVEYTRRFSWDETSKVICAALMRVAARHAGSRRPKTISSGK